MEAGDPGLFQKEDFVYQHPLSVLSFSFTPLFSLYSALFCSVGTQWPSCSAVSLSALQAGFHSLRSYYLSLFSSFPFQTLHLSIPLIFLLSLDFFNLFPFLSTSIFLSAIQSAPLPPSPSALSSHLSYILYTHKTSKTLRRNLYLLFAASCWLWFRSWRLTIRGRRNRRREGEVGEVEKGLKNRLSSWTQHAAADERHVC